MSTVRVARDLHGEVENIAILRGMLQNQDLKSKFPDATGLKYCLDGVWTMVKKENDAFIPPKDNHLLVVVNNVFNVDGPNEEKFYSCQREYTRILREEPPRNLAVITGNSEFVGNDMLPGAKTDLDVMTMMMSSPPFNYTVLKCSNMTVEQMKTVTQDAQGLCTEGLNSFLWFISTHGYVGNFDGHQMLEGSDGRYVKLTELMISTPVVSMPKIYLVNACRLDGLGDQIDTGVECQEMKEMHISEEQTDKSTVPDGGDCNAGDGDKKEAITKTTRSGDDPGRYVPCQDTDTDSWMMHCPPNFLLFFACRIGQGILDFIPFVHERISWMVHSIKEVSKRINHEASEPVNLLSLLTAANCFCCYQLEDNTEGRKYTFVLEHRLTSYEGLCFPQQLI